MSVKNNFVDINGKDIEDKLCAEVDSHGLMCPEDKVKLLGIEEGATKTIVDSELSFTSENPVQNKVVNTALDDKLNIADLLDLTDEEITNICTFDGDGDNIIPIASQTSVGCVAVGNGLNVDTQGTLNVTALTEEELKQICDFDEGMSDENIVPRASKSLLGCVVVGNGLSVDENGTIATEVASIEKGGTNANTISEARNNINFIGLNPVSTVEEDTPETWRSFGNGIAFYHTANLITDQPAQYGLLQNFSRSDSGLDIHQVWYQQGNNKTSMWHRSGNTNGWGMTWTKILDENTGVQIAKLWENASPASAFASQTISLNLSSYDMVYIVISPWADNTRRGGILLSIGEEAAYSTVASSVNTHRQIQATTTGVYFGAGGYYATYNNTTNTGSNSSNIPLYIIGIKGVL